MLLRLTSVSKRFGGVTAVDGVSFDVNPGEALGLIGPNGSGKTTLVNLISGLLASTGGEIRFDGNRIDGKPPHIIARLGVARTYQNIRLFGSMTVLDNVLVGLNLRHQSALLDHVLYRSNVPADARERTGEATALLEEVGLQPRQNDLAGKLSYGEQRRLEIARALALEPKLLILDEPAAGMTSGEIDELETMIRVVRARSIALLLIEHHVSFVMNVCDRVAVLNYGQLIANGPPQAVREDPKVRAAYLGE